MNTLEIPDRQTSAVLGHSLVWLPEHGIGYFPVPAENHPYNADYFAKYDGYAQTELGRRITAFRVDLVRRHIGDGTLIDVGIGNGSFIEARGGKTTWGIDVNPVAVEWLNQRHRRWAVDAIPSASFWDALEHFRSPEEILSRVRSHVFLSIPIFRDADHVRGSRHYRRNEHYWYFTRDGLVRWIAGCGFVLLEESVEETRLGREDIGTFVFARAV